MKVIKKSISILLCLLTLFGSTFSFLPVNAVIDDTADDGWTTKSISYNNDSNTQYTVSAKGNDIKIVIKSSYIKDDEIYCIGTKSWSGADGIDIFKVYFSDNPIRENTQNHFSLNITDFYCGENTEPHYISASKDVQYSLYYWFYENENSSHGACVGSYYTSDGKFMKGDYQGKMSECKKLNITVSRDTITVTTTLPDEIVDYYNESKRSLDFDSDNLCVSGALQSCFYYKEETNFFKDLIDKTREVFRKFFELLRKFFTFDF
ncbi:MAG: hypothetical protein IJK60_00330 [Clostridia bacterium]|nr:hypothetical protein [Clostridia bacterium]